MMRSHVFFFSVIWLIFCPVGYTPTKYNIYRRCISQPGARIWNFHESQEDKIMCFILALTSIRIARLAIFALQN